MHNETIQKKKRGRSANILQESGGYLETNNNKEEQVQIVELKSFNHFCIFIIQITFQYSYFPPYCDFNVKSKTQNCVDANGEASNFKKSFTTIIHLLQLFLECFFISKVQVL